MPLPTVGQCLEWNNTNKVSNWFQWLMAFEPTEREHDWLIEFDDDYRIAFEAMLALAED